MSALDPGFVPVQISTSISKFSPTAKPISSVIPITTTSSIIVYVPDTSLVSSTGGPYISTSSPSVPTMGTIIHPSVYTGAKEQSAFNWLKRFEAVCSGNNWLTGQQKIRHMHSFLDSTALSWFNSAGTDPTTISWVDVKVAFLKYFDQASNMLSLELELKKGRCL